MNPPPRPPDYGAAALLIYIGMFGLLCAILIVKESWLGWALFFKNLAYAVAWTFGGLLILFPHLFPDPRIRDGIRWMVALVVTWAAIQLIIARYLLWQERRAQRAE